jgi:glutamate--cysteine ligase
MSAPPSGGGAPIHSRQQLIEYFAAGNKPRAAWRMGTEHEKFGFDKQTLRPLPYDGERGVRAMLEGLRRFGWEAVTEGNNIIALSRGQASVTLEPGGQFELSGAPVETVHETSSELHAHLAQVGEVARPLGLGFLALGMSPKWSRAETPIMPKGRYRIMKAYMPKVGTLGLDMMFRTCTVQTNLDFSSEADMVKKLRVGLALQPVATALFANSPFTDGKLNGYLSFRSEIWRDTDADRSGMLPWAFEPGMSFERWVDYALDVPMYFIKRGDRYIDVAGSSFRDLMVGKLAAAPGERATISDWANHLTTIFPEVRLKRYLEMRGADTGPRRRLASLPALWVGLIYDDVALDAAWDLVKDWTAEERQKLRDEVPKLALRASVRGRPVRDIARACLEIARAGLARRARLDIGGRDEGRHLETLDEIVERGVTPAEDLIEKYKGPWGGSVEPVFAEEAY